MRDNFFDLLQYTEVKGLTNIDRNDVLRELKYYLNMEKLPNQMSYDIIDYERLIFLEMNFNNDIEINKLLKELKERITKNYITRKQLIQRLNAEVIW